ncbi:WXG100 family type VII secretion target [Nocardioides sp. URHA0032]|jgi:WXG100 family type VII secretion target|uniref:WXG100 family type VII secretion target n=1 Tax=Nocardioides sp. URHA0032 TaxID=1380388 RepID=UPI0006891814|nr:WXG100 family type VII secretion target [Nocardioides sp. URHA0032]
MYAVDLEELLATVDLLGRCGEELDELLAAIAGRVAVLHDTWSGRAAGAQATAQAEWESGFREMREGLAAMRAAGSTAHDRYRSAADTNVRMWQQVAATG